MKPAGIDIKPGEWEIVRGILDRRVPGREVWAFGSRARGTAKAFSDLDLAILGNDSLDLSTLAELTDDFSESNLSFKVDVIDWATTGKAFRKVIEGDRVVVQRPAHEEEPGK
jgi:predicted nucleotidyltransferase